MSSFINLNHNGYLFPFERNQNLLQDFWLKQNLGKHPTIQSITNVNLKYEKPVFKNVYRKESFHSQESDTAILSEYILR